MGLSRGVESIVLLTTVACGALSGCYETTVDGGKLRPDDAESPGHEMSSSSLPPVVDVPEPMMAPEPQPTDPPTGRPDVPEPMTAPDPEPEDPSVLIVGEPGYLFMQSGQIVGDMDGDGFDEFVLFAMATNDLNLLRAPAGAAYLFYGHEDLPKVVEAASANAVLRGVGFAIPVPPFNANGALSDLNGDGLADLVIGSMDSAYFIFGSEERLQGEHDIADAGVTWTFPEASRPSIGRPVRAAAAGDVQGDGLSDFTLTVSTDVVIEDFGGGVGTVPVDSTYLVLGRHDEWPSGAFDPQWAETAFVVEESAAGGCSVFGSGDLNGDGFTDLILQAETVRRLVSGGDDMPSGTVDATEAGEAFDLPGGWLRTVPDLDGDGSQELVWTDIVGSEKLYLTYGSANLDPAQLVVPHTIVDAQGMRLPATAVADFDGDGAADLLVVAGASRETPFGLYSMSTEGLRAAGEVSLENARLLLAVRNAPSSPTPLMSLGLDAGGDVNGDGVDDVLITTVADAPMPLGNTEVRLLFGG